MPQHHDIVELGSQSPFWVLQLRIHPAIAIVVNTSSLSTTMDLDDFDAVVAKRPLDSDQELLGTTPKAAVEYIDAQWYTAVNRRARWMDLIGDYAGSEPFVVDGM